MNKDEIRNILLENIQRYKKRIEYLNSINCDFLSPAYIKATTKYFDNLAKLHNLDKL